MRERERERERVREVLAWGAISGYLAQTIREGCFFV